MEREEIVEDLQAQLQVAKSDLEAAENKIDEDEELIESLQVRIEGLQAELDETLDKLAKKEETSQYTAENSHETNVELKKQLEDFKSTLAEKSSLDKQVKELTEEVTELRAKNEELSFQQERSSTRSKLKSINEEKNVKEEIQRLQKAMRMANVGMKFKASAFDSQLKACQDKNDRLQEKLKVANSRFDELDKERLELKLGNSRLQNKLEKTGSFVEMKRMQTIQATLELELENLRKRNEKLEEQLDGGEGGRNLSVRDQKRETIKLINENKILVEKNESLEQTSEVFSLKVKQLDGQLKMEKDRVKQMEVKIERMSKIAACGSEDYIAGLHKQIEILEATSSDIETNFRVKEKDLWLTIEAQRKKIEELELAKLSFELGDEEEADPEDKSYATESSQQEPNEEIETLVLENTKLKEELRAALQNSEGNRGLSEMRSEEVEAANRRLQDALDESSFEKQKLTNDFVSCQAELHDLNSREEMLTKELEEARVISKQAPSLEEFQTLKQQLAELKNSAAHTKGPVPDNIADLEMEVDRLNKLNSQLMQDLEAAEEDASHMEDGIVENSKLRANIEKLEEQNRKYQDDLESAEEELEKLDADLVEQTRVLKEEIQLLKKENEKQAILGDQRENSIPGHRIKADSVEEPSKLSVTAPRKHTTTTVVVAKKAKTQPLTEDKKAASVVHDKPTEHLSSPLPTEKPKKQPPRPALKKPSSRRKV